MFRPLWLQDLPIPLRSSNDRNGASNPCPSAARVPQVASYWQVAPFAYGNPLFLPPILDRTLKDH